MVGSFGVRGWTGMGKEIESNLDTRLNSIGNNYNTPTPNRTDWLHGAFRRFDFGIYLAGARPKAQRTTGLEKLRSVCLPIQPHKGIIRRCTRFLQQRHGVAGIGDELLMGKGICHEIASRGFYPAALIRARVIIVNTKTLGDKTAIALRVITTNTQNCASKGTRQVACSQWGMSLHRGWLYPLA
jgi:hypothetical protein